MGLDITAYRRVKKLDAVFDSYGDPIDPETRETLDYAFKANVNSDFPGRAEGLEDSAVYSAQDSMGFRAGSYSGYNEWREQLAKMAGYPAVPVDRYGTGNVRMRHDQGAWDAESGPFWLLINFSDCEGVIGPVVSAKLAKEFAEWDEQAKQHDAAMPEQFGRFYELYKTWREAFEMAADEGAVDFH